MNNNLILNQRDQVLAWASPLTFACTSYILGVFSNPLPGSLSNASHDLGPSPPSSLQRATSGSWVIEGNTGTWVTDGKTGTWVILGNSGYWVTDSTPPQLV